MPRYFFKVTNSDLVAGSESLILADRAAAWNEAMRACGDMISDGHLKMGAGWRMEVWDEEGPIFVVRVDAHELFLMRPIKSVAPKDLGTCCVRRC